MDQGATWYLKAEGSASLVTGTVCSKIPTSNRTNSIEIHTIKYFLKICGLCIPKYTISPIRTKFRKIITGPQKKGKNKDKNSGITKFFK
jgi:hypothetical protein